MLELELRLDHVGAGYFPASFLLLRDLEEQARFIHTAARIHFMPLGGDKRVIALYDGGDEASDGDVLLGARSRFRRDGSLVIGALGRRE